MEESNMTTGAPKPKFVVDEAGKKSAVVLSIRDYERLLSAWEKVLDASDFAAAHASATDFISTDELRRRAFK